MAKPGPTRRVANVLAAEAWAELREPLDRQLSPLGLRAIEAPSPRSGEVIVDIGCGTGQTVLQLANLVGPGVASSASTQPPCCLTRHVKEQVGLATSASLKAMLLCSTSPERASTHSSRDLG
jgi:hypothetical protein